MGAPMPFTPLSLASVETFKCLSSADRERLEARLEPIAVERGVALVTEGDVADALYVVVSGRFSVEIDGHSQSIAEISRGSPIGEIAFFAGGTRTATVRAIRDSVVVRLTRADFDEISAHAPHIWEAIVTTLATRLAAETRRIAALNTGARIAKARSRARTLAVIGAGPDVIPAPFLDAFVSLAAAPGTRGIAVCAPACDRASPPSAQPCATDAFDALEQQHETVVFITDPAHPEWSEKAIRQADEILLVGAPLEGPIGATIALNRLEAFALSLHKPEAIRLALVHARKGIVQGTRHWLKLRNPSMHHHAALGDAEDIARLWRFLHGEALGFVACGGGAYCAAHIGLYRAFRENGIGFDIVGGTSGGAAMAAAFAQDVDADVIATGVQRMFIEGKALARYTLPRYSLLDHTHFDAQLAAEYGTIRIEDLWKPYYAVSADLATCDIEVHRTNELWKAIRASAAIPGLLPPFYTDDGRTLVDGSIIANVPIETMHALKSGPNIVVSFETSAHHSLGVDYESLPARRELLWRTLNPFSGEALPQAPSAATVLVRSLMANRGHFERHLQPSDWLLVPPVPADMGALDWRRHREVTERAYRYGCEEIAKRYGKPAREVFAP
jgi:NTE family protein